MADQEIDAFGQIVTRYSFPLPDGWDKASPASRRAYQIAMDKEQAKTAEAARAAAFVKPAGWDTVSNIEKVAYRHGLRRQAEESAARK
jgi:hypothetical protein